MDNLERWITDTGQVIYAHKAVLCTPPCPIHAPSQHTLVGAPRHWRDDRGLIERICKHGVGHPDPDDYGVRFVEGTGVHGCDGCCRKVGNEPEINVPEAT